MPHARVAVACVGQHGCMASDDFDDNPLEPAEELDSDEVRNEDGDEVVDPPEEWIEAKDNETLDERSRRRFRMIRATTRVARR